MTDWEDTDDRDLDDAGFEESAPSHTAVPDIDGDGVEILAMLEAMLFASPEPLTADEIAAALGGISATAIEASLDRLGRAMRGPDRGLTLEKIAGGYRLVTRPELAAPLRALFRFRNQKRLTPATLDVLAIVAYAQPITAPEIQEIRGTDSAYALKVLLERKLVRIVGRKRVVGRPILYGTTREFLVHFGLDSLEDLPPVEGYGTQVVPAQGRLFPVTERQETGVIPLGEDDIDGDDFSGEDDGEEGAEAATGYLSPTSRDKVSSGDGPTSSAEPESGDDADRSTLAASAHPRGEDS